MSRATVRAAVAEWFNPQYVDGLTSIWRSTPKIKQPADLIPPSTSSGAAAEVYIKAERESRRALGGEHSGKKMVTYDVALVVQFASVETESEAAMDACDALIENLKIRLRADRTLGSTVWQAGEGPLTMTGDQLVINSDLPKLIGDTTHVWFTLDFSVVDWETT